MLEPDRPIGEIVGQLTAPTTAGTDDPTLRRMRNIMRDHIRNFEECIKTVFSRRGSPAPSPACTVPPSPVERQQIDSHPPMPLTPIQPCHPAAQGPLPHIHPSESDGKFHVVNKKGRGEQGQSSGEVGTEIEREKNAGEQAGPEDVQDQKEPEEDEDMQPYLDAFSNAVPENEVDLTNPARWASIYNSYIGPCLFSTSIPQRHHDPSQPGPSNSSIVSITAEVRCINPDHRDMGLPCALSPLEFPFQLDLVETLRQLENLQSSRIWQIMALIAQRAFTARHGHTANSSEAASGGGKGKRRA